MNVHTSIPLVDTVLEEYKSQIGSQFQPYRNHVYRVLNLCFMFRECTEEEREKLALAACFHDLGIWPNDTVDYLAPSIALARGYIVKHNREAWVDEISAMIDLHHRFRTVRNSPWPLVEVFRKGDWVDASLGLRRFGIPAREVRAIQRAFPNLGFHANLMRLAFKQFRRKPWNPLPMMKW